MRKLFWQTNVTLNGFMEGPKQELDRTAQVEDEDYWPSATGADADRMNQLPKVVFSRTLQKVDWTNSRLVKDDAAGEVARLKAAPGKDLALFGSAGLASTFIRLGLIDEYRVLVTPFVLDSGTPMFKDLESAMALKLLSATTWRSGIVALRYQPARSTR